MTLFKHSILKGICCRTRSFQSNPSSQDKGVISFLNFHLFCNLLLKKAIRMVKLLDTETLTCEDEINQVKIWSFLINHMQLLSQLSLYEDGYLIDH